MICYMWAAQHWAYAKYLFCNLIVMENLLNEEAETMFLSGDHVCWNSEGSWNSVFHDQFREKAYICCGKAKEGLVGLTLLQDQVAACVLSHHMRNYVSLIMDQMFADECNGGKSTKHTEEGANRRKLDAANRQTVREQIEQFENLLESMANKVVNLGNGCVANDKVNVADAISIGQQMAADFQESLPDGFHKHIHTQMYTNEIMKKDMKIGNQTIYNLEKLYSQLLVI